MSGRTVSVETRWSCFLCEMTPVRWVCFLFTSQVWTITTSLSGTCRCQVGLVQKVKLLLVKETPVLNECVTPCWRGEQLTILALLWVTVDQDFCSQLKLFTSNSQKSLHFTASLFEPLHQVSPPTWASFSCILWTKIWCQTAALPGWMQPGCIRTDNSQPF